jgi:hypothetical protein
MNSEFDFAEACYPDRWKVLGKMLKPFTLGHSLLLSRLCSPVIEGIAVNKVRCSDLIQAVEICSRRFCEAEKWIAGKTTLALRLRSMRIAFACQFSNEFLKTEASKFSEYFSDSQMPPRGIFKKPGGSIASEPLPLLYFCDLASRFAITWEQLMDMPLRKANFIRHRLLAEDDRIRWRASWMEGAAHG